MDDAHFILVEANANLNGIRNLTANAENKTLSYLTAFELDMMLEPITKRLEKAMKIMENEQHISCNGLLR